MTNLFSLITLIQPARVENSKKGKNGTSGTKCKILLQEMISNHFFVATVTSNRAARKAIKEMGKDHLIYVYMGEERPRRFLSFVPGVQVSDLKFIEFFKEKEV